MNLSNKAKNILSALLIIIGICFLGDTNNNPNAFIQRIFKPVKLGNSTFYYSGFLIILLIYFSFKWMYKFGNYKLLNTTTRRILATIIIIIVSIQLITSGIKISKSMAADLNAIYYNREYADDGLAIATDNEGNKTISCMVELENCSDKEQKFYIELLIPEQYRYLIPQKEYLSDEKFILHAKEKKVIYTTFSGNTSNTNNNHFWNTKDFEFLLINDKEQVKFIKKQ